MNTLNEICINDIDSYNYGMQKSLYDKMWFFPLLDNEKYNFVDYGCADGSLLKALNSMNGDYNYFGYDICEEMLIKAEQNFSNAKYYSNWLMLLNDLNNSDGVLNISSLIHEVYSYCDNISISDFWENVFNTIDFKYIAIRDMFISNKSKITSNKNDVAKIYHYADNKMLNEFESQWGSIEYLPNMIHWLLKYRYKENWNREIKENYLPLTTEDLYKIISFNDYEIVYQEHYTLPFLKDTVNNDFNIELKENTHLKLLLRRK